MMRAMLLCCPWHWPSYAIASHGMDHHMTVSNAEHVPWPVVSGLVYGGYERFTAEVRARTQELQCFLSWHLRKAPLQCQSKCDICHQVSVDMYMFSLSPICGMGFTHRARPEDLGNLFLYCIGILLWILWFHNAMLTQKSSILPGDR